MDYPSTFGKRMSDEEYEKIKPLMEEVTKLMRKLHVNIVVPKSTIYCPPAFRYYTEEDGKQISEMVKRNMQLVGDLKKRQTALTIIPK